MTKEQRVNLMMKRARDKAKIDLDHIVTSNMPWEQGFDAIIAVCGDLGEVVESAIKELEK